MTKVTVSHALGVQLNSSAGPVELCDETGRTLGYFHPAIPLVGKSHASQSPSPLSEEELRRRREEAGGRPLADILGGLQQR